MMKKFFLPKKNDGECRVRPLRTAVICVLIAALLISVSVAMGYSKYLTVSDPFEIGYQVKDYVLPSGSYVSLAKAADPATSYVFHSPDGKATVIYSKESTDDTLTNAEYLVAEFVPGIASIDYEASSNQISYSYEIGLTCVNHADSFDPVGLASSISGESRGIVVSLPVDRDADPASITADTLSISNASGDTMAISKTKIATDGLISIGSFGQLFDYSGEGELLNSFFALSYDKKGWAAYTDTDWYNTEDDEFWISNAAELAGLAKLVNDGSDSFENKKVYISANISLADANGYLRKWTPIGTFEHPFAGEFIGQNYTISGLNVADFGAAGEYAAAGLFGYVDGAAAAIGGFTLDTAYLAASLKDASQAPSGAAGAVVGWMENGTISDVTVNDASVCGAAACGGIVAGRVGSTVTADNCQLTGSGAVGSGYTVSGDIFGYQTPAEP